MFWELSVNWGVNLKSPSAPRHSPHTSTKNRMSGTELFVQFLSSAPAEEPPDGCVCSGVMVSGRSHSCCCRRMSWFGWTAESCMKGKTPTCTRWILVWSMLDLASTHPWCREDWAGPELTSSTDTNPLQMHNDLFINTRYSQRYFCKIHLMLYLQFNTNAIRPRLCTHSYDSLAALLSHMVFEQENIRQRTSLQNTV